MLVDCNSLVRQGHHSGELQSISLVEHMPVPEPEGVYNQLDRLGVPLEIKLRRALADNSRVSRIPLPLQVFRIQFVDACETVWLWSIAFSFPAIHGCKRHPELCSELL